VEKDKQKPVRIRVRVFEDQNGNKLLDQQEKGQKGWTITVTNLTTQAMLTDKSNGDGRASFNALAAGDYRVCATVQSGWINTLPGGAACYTLTLRSGQTAEVLFGNQKAGAVSAANQESVAVSGILIHMVDDADGAPLVEFTGAQLLHLPLVRR
jgi:SdrD B-like domain